MFLMAVHAPIRECDPLRKSCDTCIPGKCYLYSGKVIPAVGESDTSSRESETVGIVISLIFAHDTLPEVFIVNRFYLIN